MEFFSIVKYNETKKRRIFSIIPIKVQLFFSYPWCKILFIRVLFGEKRSIRNWLIFSL